MNFYKIVPSRGNYISLRERLKEKYEIIEVSGEWFAIQPPLEGDNAETRWETALHAWAWWKDRDVEISRVKDVIDIRDLTAALEKKKRGRTEWVESV